MWNASYESYVKQLVLSNKNEYPYYIAHTCTYWNTTNSSALPAFKVYFSKEPISATGEYTYVFKGDTVCYSVVGGNATNNYHNERVQISNVNNNNLYINDYEFIYTNAEFSSYSVHPDVMATSNVTSSHFDGVSLILIVILLVAQLVRFLRGN